MDYPNIRFRESDLEQIKQDIANKNYTAMTIEELFALKRARENERKQNAPTLDHEYCVA